MVRDARVHGCVLLGALQRAGATASVPTTAKPDARKAKSRVPAAGSKKRQANLIR
jgi:hypothetical protein